LKFTIDSLDTFPIALDLRDKNKVSRVQLIPDPEPGDSQSKQHRMIRVSLTDGQDLATTVPKSTVSQESTPAEASSLSSELIKDGVDVNSSDVDDGRKPAGVQKGKSHKSTGNSKHVTPNSRFIDCSLLDENYVHVQSLI
jgi:hypothetical protein